MLSLLFYLYRYVLTESDSMQLFCCIVMQTLGNQILLERPYPLHIHPYTHPGRFISVYWMIYLLCDQDRCITEDTTLYFQMWDID